MKTATALLVFLISASASAQSLATFWPRLPGDRPTNWTHLERSMTGDLYVGTLKLDPPLGDAMFIKTGKFDMAGNIREIELDEFYFRCPKNGPPEAVHFVYTGTYDVHGNAPGPGVAGDGSPFYMDIPLQPGTVLAAATIIACKLKT